MTKFVVMLSILLALPGIVWSGMTRSAGQGSELLVAQQAPPQEALQTAEGKITNVDTQNQTLQLQTTEGEQLQFAYSDQTQVVSRERVGVGVGATVRISYQIMGGSNLAIRIEEV